MADVSEKDDIKRLADEMAQKEPKGIQLLVNNAGIARDDSTKYSSAGQPDLTDPNAISEHFWKSEPESWAETFKTNVGSVYYMSIAVRNWGTCPLSPGMTANWWVVSNIPLIDAYSPFRS